jgi:hypothetical protein
MSFLGSLELFSAPYNSLHLTTDSCRWSRLVRRSTLRFFGMHHESCYVWLLFSTPSDIVDVPL